MMPNMRKSNAITAAKITGSCVIIAALIGGGVTLLKRSESHKASISDNGNTQSASAFGTNVTLNQAGRDNNQARGNLAVGAESPRTSLGGSSFQNQSAKVSGANVTLNQAGRDNNQAGGNLVVINGYSEE